jgi:hypothetical protein
MSSDNATGAENQQGSPLRIVIDMHDPSETTRRAPRGKQKFKITNSKKITKLKMSNVQTFEIFEPCNLNIIWNLVLRI